MPAQTQRHERDKKCNRFGQQDAIESLQYLAAILSFD
jgi:hypothetical protein